MKRIKQWIVSALIGATLLGAGVPDYKVVCDALGNIEGYQAEKCEGTKMSNPMMGEMVSANRSYTAGEKHLNVTVVSGMQAMGMWAPFMSGTQVENDEALMKIEQINGFNVGITYDKKEHSGGIVVQLASNAMLAFEFENMDWKEALEAAKELDWQALKSLFERSE